VTAPHDIATFNNMATGAQFSEPASAIARVTCKPVAAAFTGKIPWSLDAPWRGGALSGMPRREAVGADDSTAVEGGRSAGSDQVSSPSRSSDKPKFEVTKAWNDVLQGSLFVHDMLTVYGGAHDVTLRPEMFQLSLALANGGKKTYGALNQSAPQYSRYNPMTGQTQYMPEVDPATDLGHLGSMIVPAHGTVTITVTFPVSDTVADANANRDVAIR
jgi:hypothetical protein